MPFNPTYPSCINCRENFASCTHYETNKTPPLRYSRGSANVVVDSFVFPMGATGRQRVISWRNGSSLRSIKRQEKVGSTKSETFASK